jgi:hypothetical protein
MVDDKKIMNGTEQKKDFERYVPRLLGAMFLVVILIGVASGSFLSPLNYSMTGDPEDISETMTSFAEKPGMVQTSIAGFLFEAAAIVLLALLLFVVLKDQNHVLARWAYGLWILEAAFLALRQIFAFCLLFMSEEFVASGSPEGTYFQTMGSLYYGLMHFAYDVQMVFYCIGGIVFYYLFLRSGFVPKALATFGVAVASLGLVGEMVAIYGATVPLWVYLPILPFELGIGIWLVVKGIRIPASDQ